jgi:putative sterol carrier protein
MGNRERMKNRLQYTVTDGFDLLAKKIELPLDEYTSIASRQAEIESCLAQYVSTFTSVIPGAFSRKTLISPLAGCDISLFILFKYEHNARFLPANLLDKLLQTLRLRFPDALLSKKYNAVMVPFENFAFRVQPGFLTPKNAYLVPAPAWQGWIDYNSLDYKTQLLKADQVHKGRLLPVIRMLKSWNHATGSLFDDYYLELMVKEVLQDYSIRNYATALRHVFKTAVTKVVYKVNDPANPEFEVEGLHDVLDLVNAMLHFQQAYKLASRAVADEADGRVELALEGWRKVLPGVFPSAMDMVIGQIRRQGIQGAEALRLMQEVYGKP